MKSQNTKGLTFGVVLLWLMVSFSPGCRNQEPAYTERFHAFGTQIDLTLIGIDKASFERVAAIIKADFAAIHQAWHGWEPGPLGLVNKQLPTGQEFAVPPAVLPLIEHGILLSERSQGFFNPAIGKLLRLWGFQSEDTDSSIPLPADRDIQEQLRSNPKMSDLDLEGIILRGTNPSVQLDFGALGKGYAIDLITQHLRELGVHNALLNAGGDYRAIGSRDGLAWRVPIRRPSGVGVLGTINAQGDESVFTTGQYEGSHIRDGKRLHHIIDPRTGYPAKGTTAVTIIHSESITADAASTALFIAGPEKWYDIARSMGIKYVLLTAEDGTLHMNPAMAKRVHLLDPPAKIRISPPLVPGASEEAGEPTREATLEKSGK